MAKKKVTPIARESTQASTPRKSAAKSKSPKKAVAKAKPGVPRANPVKVGKAKKAAVVLLSGGNPQIAKADGDAPVQAYIAAIPGWKQTIGQRLDALIERNVPNVRKAVKWNSPFYGIEGHGWFVSFHVFTRFVKVTFFQGTSLDPVPSGGTGKEARWFDIHQNDFDEAQITTWILQAAAIPGWMA